MRTVRISKSPLYKPAQPSSSLFSSLLSAHTCLFLRVPPPSKQARPFPLHPLPHRSRHHGSPFACLSLIPSCCDPSTRFTTAPSPSRGGYDNTFHHGVPNNLYRRHLSCDLRVNAATLITQPLLLFVVQMPSDKADRTINRSSLSLAARSTYSRTVFMIYT